MPFESAVKRLIATPQPQPSKKSKQQNTNRRTGVADATCTYIGFVTGSAAGGSSTRQINFTLPVSPSPPLPVLNNTNSPADPAAGYVTAPATLAIDSVVTGVGTTPRND